MQPNGLDNQSTTQKDWTQASDQEIFDTDIIIALGLEAMSDEEKAAFTERMTQTVQKAIVSRVLDLLSPEQQEELDRRLDNDDFSQINDFLRTSVPEFDDIVTKETIAFKRAMLTGDVS